MKEKHNSLDNLMKELKDSEKLYIDFFNRILNTYFANNKQK